MKPLLNLFASRKTSIVFLVAATVGSLFNAQVGWGGNYPLLAIIALLAVNLSVCLSMNARKIWRRSIPLFFFHIGLIGTALASLWSGLTFYHATFQLAEEQAITNRFESPRKGPLYRSGLDEFELVLKNSTILHNGDIDLGVKEAHNYVEATDPKVGVVRHDLQYNEPLLYGAYRFYLAPDQGYAVVFRYVTRDGASRPGAVYLPGYPSSRARQISTFRVSGAADEQMSVRIDPALLPYDGKRPWEMAAPEEPRVTVSHTVREERRQTVMTVGSKIELENGALYFDSVRLWHRFLVDYDPTRPYLSASLLLAIIGLSWHYIALVFLPRNKRRPGRPTKRTGRDGVTITPDTTGLTYDRQRVGARGQHIH